jgi:hypothetical protein
MSVGGIMLRRNRISYKAPPMWPNNPNSQSATSNAIIVHSAVHPYFPKALFMRRQLLAPAKAMRL